MEVYMYHNMNPKESPDFKVVRSRKDAELLAEAGLLWAWDWWSESWVPTVYVSRTALRLGNLAVRVEE